MISKSPTDEYIILEDLRKPMKVELFRNTIMLQYEKEFYPCPENYDQLLKIWYGDYMQIPPEGIEYLKQKDKLETKSFI